MVYNASIGGHLRHIIEHYQSFFRGLESGRLDYEQRARDAAIETVRRLPATFSRQ